MAAPVSVRLRQEVAERAAYCCEDCGLPQRFALHAHEPDHIVPRQHGGESHLQNLAWACLRCNRYNSRPLWVTEHWLSVTTLPAAPWRLAGPPCQTPR
jgi:5-methylcytosine-specific restriction endonuclease McrA